MYSFVVAIFTNESMGVKAAAFKSLDQIWEIRDVS